MQNSSSAWIWWLVGVAIIIGGGWWILSGSQTAAPTENAGTPSGAENTSAPVTAAVTYDGTSFSPSSVTIQQGGSVTFASSVNTMWVASAPHPAHTGYDDTARDVHCAVGYAGAAPFDQCRAGPSYTFTFTKTGTWPFHDHANATAFGSVTVVQ